MPCAVFIDRKEMADQREGCGRISCSRFRSEIQNVLHEPHPRQIIIEYPLGKDSLKRHPWIGGEAKKDDALLLRMKHRNLPAGLMAILLPLFFGLITANAASAGYFADHPEGVLPFGVCGILIAMGSFCLIKLFLFRSTWLFMEPERIVLRREGVLGSKVLSIATLSATKIIRDQCPLMSNSKGSSTGLAFLVAIVHDGTYTELAGPEHGTVWLARLLGAATGLQPSGILS